MNVNDDELRQAYAVMESYKERVEALSRQVQMLRVSLDEVTLASNSLKAFHEAKEGDEMMVPVGAQCLVTVKVTSKKNVIVGIGSNLSVEKTPVICLVSHAEELQTECYLDETKHNLY